MKIKFKCECGKRIKTSVKKIGRQLQCPLCQRKIIIPDVGDESVLNLECEECNIPFSKNLDQCPSCHKIVEIENAYEDVDYITTPPKSSTNVYYIIWGVCIIISLTSIIYIIINLKTLKILLG